MKRNRLLLIPLVFAFLGAATPIQQTVTLDLAQLQRAVAVESNHVMAFELMGWDYAVAYFEGRRSVYEQMIALLAVQNRSPSENALVRPETRSDQQQH